MNSIFFMEAIRLNVRCVLVLFLKKKGASGSWAEPYFACPTLRCGGFTYPPGIL
jgi:hypothetical protein